MLVDKPLDLFFFAKLLHAKSKHTSGQASINVVVCNIFVLDEVRTRQILREKADCKQSNKPWDFENPTCQRTGHLLLIVLASQILLTCVNQRFVSYCETVTLIFIF